MATYAIGDVHGCFKTLQKLLQKIRLDRRDRLWMVGDLVNRGPRSLAVLRWAVEQGDRLVAVLGNHDLHLLARAAGVSTPRRRDSLEEVLAAPDRDDLVRWLRTRPLLHREGGFTLVHAGLFPEWTPGHAAELARETEAALCDGSAPGLLASFERKAEERWDESLRDGDRVRVALAGFARLRTLQPDGRMCTSFSGPPRDAPDGCVPWFDLPERRSRGETVVFGHWAALGLRIGDGVAGLDTGCAWGQELTALRLEDGRIFQQKVVD